MQTDLFDQLKQHGLSFRIEPAASDTPGRALIHRDEIGVFLTDAGGSAMPAAVRYIDRARAQYSTLSEIIESCLARAESSHPQLAHLRAVRGAQCARLRAGMPDGAAQAVLKALQRSTDSSAAHIVRASIANLHPCDWQALQQAASNALGAMEPQCMTRQAIGARLRQCWIDTAAQLRLVLPSAIGACEAANDGRTEAQSLGLLTFHLGCEAILPGEWARNLTEWVCEDRDDRQVA